jgi:hypothetical protein
LRKTAARLSKLIRRDPLRGLLAAAAWATFAFIVFSTLAPLHWRPVVTRNADLERFAAFAMLGLLFGLAYPHRRIADLAFVVSAAGVLEILQLITRDRHGHLLDAVIKVWAEPPALASRSLFWGWLSTISSGSCAPRRRRVHPTPAGRRQVLTGRRRTRRQPPCRLPPRKPSVATADQFENKQFPATSRSARHDPRH